MKKHFLLLLMAFMSLAGWAQDPIDITGYTVDLTKISAAYTGQDRSAEAGVYLKKDNEQNITEGFTVTWSEEPIDVKTTGYTVTVEGDMVHTVGTPTQTTKKFYVTKGQAGFVNDNIPTRADNKTWAQIKDNLPYSLLSNAETPEATLGATVEYSVNGGEWSTDIPTTSEVGEFTVSYRIEDGANFVGIAATALQKTTISGTELVANTDYTAPTAPDADLPFAWDNNSNAPAVQNLIKAQTGIIDATKGTFMYKVNDATEYTEGIPTASGVGTYTIAWKIKGAAGYADVAEAGQTITTKIVAIQPSTITAATGATGLVYTYEENAAKQQSLLANAGSATDGATSALKYKVRSKTPAANAQFGDWSAALALDDVKASAAGTYEIKTLVEDGGNYLAKEAATVTTVTIAQADAFTTAPSAKDLTWNNTAQELIDASGVTAPVGIVLYSTNGETYNITNPATIKGTDATTANNVYKAYYKVENLNYKAVAATEIANVQIKKRAMSVKVNNIKKTYNGYAAITGTNAGDAAVVGGEKFTFMNRLTGDNAENYNYGAVAYSEIDAANKNAGTYSKVVTVTVAGLEAISTNYEYTVVPGNLIIDKAALTVTAHADLTTVYGTPLDISNEYTITGYVNNETAATVFSTLPVLTSNATGENPEPAAYDLSFTEGTLKTPENYAVTYVTGNNKFTVTADQNRKLVITILPHTQQYTGVAEDWSNMQQGTDFEVSNLVAGDAIIANNIVFTRSDAENFNVGTYDLTTSLTLAQAVADPTQYPGGIVINPSTFDITKRVLTATIPQQTVRVGDGLDAIDPDAWTVEGLQNGEEKSILEATLTLKANATQVAATVNDGLVLTIGAANSNYAFDANGALTATGKLLVISTTTFALSPNDVNLESEIETANGENYTVQFADKTMKIGEWYAMVLPFDVDPLKMVAAFNRYVIFNELNTIKTNAKEFKFALTLNTIPAGTPFLIKFAPKTGDEANTVVDWANFNGAEYGAAKIKKGVKDVVTDYVTLTGTYASNVELQGSRTDGSENYVWWLCDTRYERSTRVNDWLKPISKPHKVAPMEAWLDGNESSWIGYAPVITVEDFDGQTTSIKSFSADKINNLNVVADGWYSLDGKKLQGAPTQKGIYINNGKKVVIK